jgi:hypothetical protein
MAKCSSRTKTCSNVLQHVDHKNTNTFLKKGTRDAYMTWNQLT